MYIHISFIEFLMECCIYGEIFVAELSKHKKLLHCKFSKLDQISCIDKTGHGFVRPWFCQAWPHFFLLCSSQ